VISLSFLSIVDVESLKNINLLIGCFFFAFTGAYLQEVSNIYKGKQRVTKIHKVVIGTIIGMGIYLILAARYIRNVGITLSVTINVICGLLGYEIFNRCSSIDNLKKTASDIHDIISNLFGITDYFDKLFGDQSKDNTPDDKKK